MIVPALTLALPVVTLAGLVDLTGCTGIENCDYGELLNLIDVIINFLTFDIALPLATIAILYSGILFVIYPAYPGKVSEAKKILKSTMIGLAIVLASYLIVKSIVYGLEANMLKSLFR